VPSLSQFDEPTEDVLGRGEPRVQSLVPLHTQGGSGVIVGDGFTAYDADDPPLPDPKALET
jgi:hypothetical protein